MVYIQVTFRRFLLNETPSAKYYSEKPTTKIVWNREGGPPASKNVWRMGNILPNLTCRGYHGKKTNSNSSIPPNWGPKPKHARLHGLFFHVTWSSIWQNRLGKEAGPPCSTGEPFSLRNTNNHPRQSPSLWLTLQS